jgi:hypothetical protein
LPVEDESMIDLSIAMTSATNNLKEYKRSDRVLVNSFIIYIAHVVLPMIHPALCINTFDCCFRLGLLASSS